MNNAEPLPAERLPVDPVPEATSSVSEVSKRTGLSQDTLRYKERAGLLAPEGRSANRQRRYASADLEWISLLLRLRETGMSIADMQHHALLRARGDSSTAERLVLLREHRAVPGKRIRALQLNGRVLDSKMRFYEENMEDHNESRADDP